MQYLYILFIKLCNFYCTIKSEACQQIFISTNVLTIRRQKSWPKKKSDLLKFKQTRKDIKSLLYILVRNFKYILMTN